MTSILHHREPGRAGFQPAIAGILPVIFQNPATPALQKRNSPANAARFICGCAGCLKIFGRMPKMAGWKPTLPRVLRALMGMSIVLLSGCRHHNQFINAPSTSPHATLTADKAQQWRDRGPIVTHVNRHPTKFWRSAEHFLLPPGEVTLQVVANREPYDFAPVRFTAVSGKRYNLSYNADRSAVRLSDLTGPQPKLITESPREKAKPMPNTAEAVANP